MYCINLYFPDHKEDADNIERALELCRDIAKDVDEQVRAHERAQLLLDIYDKTDAKTATTIKKDKKFERKDFKKKNRKLLFSETVQWKMTKKATTTGQLFKCFNPWKIILFP